MAEPESGLIALNVLRIRGVKYGLISTIRAGLRKCNPRAMSFRITSTHSRRLNCRIHVRREPASQNRPRNGRWSIGGRRSLLRLVSYL